MLLSPQLKLLPYALCCFILLMTTSTWQGQAGMTCLMAMQAQVRRINELKTRLSDSERRERQQQLQRTMTLLVHASACDNAQCPSSNCNKVKALFKHAVGCQQKVQGGCHLCR